MRRESNSFLSKLHGGSKLARGDFIFDEHESRRISNLPGYMCVISNRSSSFSIQMTLLLSIVSLENTSYGLWLYHYYHRVTKGNILKYFSFDKKSIVSSKSIIICVWCDDDEVINAHQSIGAEN